jgi:RNA polymerase sigma-70 factor (ECF subfamily)
MASRSALSSRFGSAVVAPSAKLSDAQSKTAESVIANSGEIQDDEAVVSQVLAGDKEAFRVLVERYEKKLRALVFNIVMDSADAEEVVQEAFVKTFFTLSQFRGESSFKTYLYRIAQNMAIDVRRKLHRRRALIVDSSQLEETPLGDDETSELSVYGSQVLAREPGKILSEREDLTQVNKALTSMSEDHRQVMMLREVEGMSYTEIAKVIGVSIGTVMSRLHYARKRIHSLLTKTA